MAYTPFDLSNKCVLVTGGTRGIGYGMAQALVQAGARVCIWGTAQASADAAAAALSEEGQKVIAQEVDVADEQAVVDGMQASVSALGRIDAVFANAGISRSQTPFLEMDSELFRKVVSVNLDGAFYTLREAGKHMAQRAADGDDSGGSLVGVASLAAIEGAARNQHYAATKGGLISMIRGCAVELARYGIRANAILPGWIATDMTQRAQDNPKFIDNVISRVPARRWGTPEDFGGQAVYLASDASRFQSGTTIIIDGGYSIF